MLYEKRIEVFEVPMRVLMDRFDVNREEKNIRMRCKPLDRASNVATEAKRIRFA
jgi:hypothetical protein